jgi:hypothetical protein
MRIVIMRRLLLFLVIFLFSEIYFITFDCYAGEKSVKSQSMFSAVEGNLNLYVHIGEHVKKGQLLYYVASNEIFPSEYLGAKHDVEIDRLNYIRQKRLSVTGSVSEEKLESALQKFREDVDKMIYYANAVKHGHYYAPYNAEITKIYFPDGSGMGDGSKVLSLVKV